ncbi:MAG: hypothetical protein ACQEQD_05695 [Bacillota bacterium]
MVNFLKNWGYLKHVVVSLIFTLLFNSIISIFTTNPSVGLVGGSEGISNIFFSGSPTFLISSVLFVILLLLYKPVKRMIEKN